MFAGVIGVSRGDLTPDAVDWANIGPGNSPQVNADKTMANFTGTLTIRATLSSGTYEAGTKAFRVYKNGGLVTGITPADAATLDVSVIATDTVHYEATKGTSGSTWSGTATVKVVETNQQLDTFTISVTAP